MARASLVIMAAGIGSRYSGGIKQMTPVGPDGEILMDYAVNDAIEAGFDKVVFVIRHDLDHDFREVIGDRISRVVETAYAYQELADLPEGLSVPEGRTKPWGTGQALIAAAEVINEPFVVINADDYYGKTGYRKLYELLMSGGNKGTEAEPVAMCAFILGNTLSDHGGVTRGLLELDEEGHLAGITETKNILKTASGAKAVTEEGEFGLDVSRMVSMNMWGFYPSFLEKLKEQFPVFLKNDRDPLKKEFLLPTIVDEMIKENEAEVTVVKSDDRWFGMTYVEDRQIVKDEIAKLVEAGVYRAPLF